MLEGSVWNLCIYGCSFQAVVPRALSFASRSKGAVICKSFQGCCNLQVVPLALLAARLFHAASAPLSVPFVCPRAVKSLFRIFETRP